MTDHEQAIRTAVKQYLEHGFVVFPVPYGRKDSDVHEWQKAERRWTEKDFKPDSNIALRMDAVVDIDPDDDYARKACEIVLPKTARWGRPSSGTATHYLFQVTDGTVVSETIEDGKETLIEIRTGPGHYSIAPPSFLAEEPEKHKPADILKWMSPTSLPLQISASKLKQYFKVIGTIALLARHWPGNGPLTNQHAVAGMVAALLHNIIPKSSDFERDIVRIIKEAATLARDDNVRDRERFAEDTIKKKNAGANVQGGPSLRAELGGVVDALEHIWLKDNPIEKTVLYMNEHHFYVRLGKDVVVGTEDASGDVVFQHERALQSWYANSSIMVPDAKGKLHKRSRFEIWRTHHHRRQFRRITFAPPPRIADDDEYNLWKGFAVKPIPCPTTDRAAWIDSVVAPQFAKYYQFLHEVICGGNDAYLTYLIKLMASSVQLPGHALEVAVVLKGELGVGKGVFIREFGRLFGIHFTQIDKTEQVLGHFNAAISKKVIVFADEAFWAGDRREHGALKRLITEPTLVIERKGLDPVEEPNSVHLFMATNDEWAVPASFDERRFFVLKVSSIHKQDINYFGAIRKEMTNGGAEALLTFLQSVTFDRDQLRAAPRTEELSVQQEHTLPPELRWWKEKLYLGSMNGKGDWPEEVKVEDLHRDYLDWCDKLKINRRVSLIGFSRNLLAPWLGERKHAVEDHTSWARPIENLEKSRALFEKISGVVTKWDYDAKGRQPGEDDDLPI